MFSAVTTTVPINTLMEIVAEHQARKVNVAVNGKTTKVLVDATTASVVLSVIRRLGPAAQEKFLALPFQKAVETAWRLA